MSYYVEKQFVSHTLDKAETSVMFYTYFRDVKGKILDVGCSIGAFILLDPNRIQGIDIDKKALEEARKKGLKVQHMDLRKKFKLKDNEFSAIFSSYTIEHIENPLNMMKEIYRILKPKGRLVLMTTDWIKTHGRSKSNFYDDYTHVSPFTIQSLKQIAYDSGFRDYAVRYDFKAVRGFGWAVRKGLLKPSQILFIQKLLYKLGIKSNTIILIARK
ncbi:MAG: class I SAM-dependent methyltransferase [archaeon]